MMRTPWADPSEIKAKQNLVHFISLKFFYFYLSLCWPQWVFTSSRAFLQLQRVGATLQIQGTSFSLQWLLLLQSTGSRVGGLRGCGSQALEHRLSISGAQPLLLRGMWDLSKPGMESVCPALAGRYLTTEAPGKSNPMYFNGILGPPRVNPGLTIAG